MRTRSTLAVAVLGILAAGCPPTNDSSGPWRGGAKPYTEVSVPYSMAQVQSEATSAPASQLRAGICSATACPNGCCPPPEDGGAPNCNAGLFHPIRGLTDQIANFFPERYAVADLYGDGRPELVAAATGACGGLCVTAQLTDGGWDFISTRALALRTFSPFRPGIALADFNRDGRLDVAAGPALDPESTFAEGTLIMLNDGDGGFPTHWYVAINSTAMTAAELDGAGGADLVIAQSQLLTVVHGHGDGGFTSGQALSVLAPAERLRTADVDGDGVLDLLTQASNGAVTVFVGRAGGGFADAGSTFGFLGLADMVLADWDGDGRGDVFSTASQGQGFGFRLGLADGGLGPLFRGGGPMAQGGLERLAIADFDRDGSNDLIWGGPTLEVYSCSNDGGLEARTPVPTASNIARFRVTDLNLDGAPDVTTANGGFAVLLGGGSGGCAATPVSTVCPESSPLLCTNEDVPFCCPSGRSCQSNKRCGLLDSSDVSGTEATCPAGREKALCSTKTAGTFLCCPPGYLCGRDEASCIYVGQLPPPPSAEQCGSGFCPAGTGCSNGVCCGAARPVGCGATCCLPGASCENGQCGCPSDRALCSGGCCDEGAICDDGQCRYPCGYGGVSSSFTTLCGQSCCRGDISCSGSTCQCPGDYPLACGNQCCAAESTCVGGECACPSGYEHCGQQCCPIQSSSSGGGDGTCKVCYADSCASQFQPGQCFTGPAAEDCPKGPAASGESCADFTGSGKNFRACPSGKACRVFCSNGMPQGGTCE